MTRFDRYLFSEGLPPFLFGLLLYSGLAVVGAALPRLRWILGTPVLDLTEWLGLLFPTAIVQTLPIALVLAVLLALGRLATQNEILALQMGTVPLARVILVFLAFGALATAAALTINQWVLPTTQARVASLYWELTSNHNRTGLFRLATQELPVDEFSLTFARYRRRTGEMLDIRIERWQDDQVSVVFAKSGSYVGTELKLQGYRLYTLDLSALDRDDRSAEETLRRLVQVVNRPQSDDQILTITTSVSVDELISRFSNGNFEDARSITGALEDARNESLSFDDRRRAAILFHQKIADPVANVALLLVALPLSLMYARSRGVAFGLSLVVTLLWYFLITFGQLFSQTGVLPSWMGPWLGNMVLLLLGAGSLLSRWRFR